MTNPAIPVEQKSPGSFGRFIRRLLRIIISVYLVLCIIVFFAQDWMIFPGWYEQGKPETKILFGGDAQVVHFTTSNGIPIAAVFGIARRPDGVLYTAADHRPTVLYFYGNGGSAAYSQGEFDHFRKAGCNVLIPDFPGYGQSGGKPSEKNFYASADAAWSYLQTRPEVDMKKIIVVGWSLGAGAAIDLASREPVMGLATMNAFTSLSAMAQKILPWVPTSLLLKYRFDNLTKIALIHCPVLIVNGKQDVLVPPAMSAALAKNAGGPVTRLVVESADHNTIFSAEPTLIWGAFQRWIDRLPK